MQNIINGLPIAAVILLLAVGFAFLVKGADFFVDGSSSIAKKLKVPPIIIGLTIVAMGTSLPETAVSVTASLVQNNELAVSNVVGSNIFNLMFVIGVCSILTPIMVQQLNCGRDIPLSLGCALFLLVLGISGLGDKTGMTLGHADGVIFLIVFAGYIFTMVRSAMKARAAGQKVEIEGVEECDNMKELSYGKSILFLIVGAAAIAFGGDLTVDTVSRIAIELGMSQTLVGLTIVSIGTSLPELVTSVVAARKNEADMAVEMQSDQYFQYSDGSWNLICYQSGSFDPGKHNRYSASYGIFGYGLDLYRNQEKIERKEGIIMVVVYLVYCAYIVPLIKVEKAFIHHPQREMSSFKLIGKQVKINACIEKHLAEQYQLNSQ